MACDRFRQIPDVPADGARRGWTARWFSAAKPIFVARSKALKQARKNPFQWRKLSGPGKVTFANANAAQTTATFSAPRRVRLALDDEARRGNRHSTSCLPPSWPRRRPSAWMSCTPSPTRSTTAVEARAKSLIVNWIPHCIDHIERTDLTQGQGGIENFVEAAKALRGEPHGRHKGYVFANAWVHQTVESMCIALMVDAERRPGNHRRPGEMPATLEDWIPKILAAQEPDGYLQTAYTLADRNHWPERWDPPTAEITRATWRDISSSPPSTTTRSPTARTSASTMPPRNWPIAGWPTSGPSRQEGMV